MVITGVAIGNQRLGIEGRVNTTSCYKAFMNYCIEHRPPNVLTNPPINKYFKIGSENPEFKRGIVYHRIIGHNHIFYSTYNNTHIKIFRMKKIADFLEINLHLFDDQGNLV